MQVTIPAKGQSEKKFFELSQAQVEALEYERFESVDTARATIGKQAKMILRGLVNKELFKESAKGIFTRTALGGQVAKVIAERS